MASTSKTLLCARKRRKELTLKQKVEVIQYVKANPGVGARKVADVFECGKTQIQSILLRQASILSEYEGSGSSDRKRSRSTDYAEVNDAMYKWYCLARQRCIPLSGPLLQEEALLIARRIDPNTSFKASNGWLDSFKKRHNIKQMAISGECADVQEETVAGWHERVKFIMKGYQPQDVWNTDETGCFYRTLPNKTLADMKKECRGGKMAKERLTIAFFVNAAGEKEPPVIIGKSASPRYFKGLRDKANPHGLPYFSNPKAWMNTEIMHAILAKLNRKMVRQGRQILLLLDNVSSHSPHLKDLFSNIKVVFLPKNTTSRLQPLDAGIIKNFKVHYRKLLIRHTLAAINDTEDNASKICKSVNVLLAIRWIKQAWELVSPTTIKNCFKHCGALSTESEEELTDPFSDLDTQGCDVADLDELLTPFDSCITATEYVDEEDDLSTCYVFDKTEKSDWREGLRVEVLEDCSEPKRPALGNENDSHSSDEELECTSIRSLDVALTLAKDLMLFLVEKGEEEAAENQQKVISSLEIAKLKLHVNHTKQTTLDSFLRH